MEAEKLIANHQPSTRERVLAAAGPLLWIAVSYIDPGKWATSVEGGARFGFDIALLMLIINLTAILCQYMSACITVATGKDLAQVCCEEYDDITCVLLGIQAETSMIVLDLTMVLGSAYGLNAVFGIGMFTSILLTGFDAVLFPYLASILENSKAKFLSTCLACFTLAAYVCGILISQPESSVSMGWILNKLSGENVYVLMSLLGANIMPHNFYLHSSIVQQDQRQTNFSKEASCHDHFFATLCIYSGIFIVNCVLMNLAANVFYSSGLVSLTLQDALSLLDQTPGSSIASVVLILIIFISNQLIPLPWSYGRVLITDNLFKLDISSWVHRSTIRIIAIISALYCVWSSGAEGIFQFLIFTHVVVALLLPSSVIPLFQVASSRSIMGDCTISHSVKFLALVSFIGMLGLQIFFVIEMIFGDSEWVSNLKWNIGSNVPTLYVILLTASFVSLCSILWLAITPLKSASFGLDTPALQWDQRAAAISKSFIETDRSEIVDDLYQSEKAIEKQEPLSLDRSLENQQNLSIPDLDLNLLQNLLDSESNFHSTAILEEKSESAQASTSIPEIPLPEFPEVIKTETPDTSSVITETKEEDVQNEKDGDRDSREPEESPKDVTETSQILTSESTSLRNLNGKIDDIGSGTGSLSRLAGLGRAARRQLTIILDEFWGQIFDYHGQIIQDAKAKKLNILFGVDSKVDTKLSFEFVKPESFNKESSTGYFSSAPARGHDSLTTSSMHNSSMQQIGQSNIGSYLGVQKGPSMLSNRMPQFDSYVQKPTNSALDSAERRYYSVHVPSSSDVYSQQPATIHGYDRASYLGRSSKEDCPDYLKGQLESLTKISSPTIKSSAIDPYSRSLGQRPQSGQRAVRPPGFHNVPVSRNNSLKSERPSYNISSHEPLDYNSQPPNEKKYYSMPDISGLYTSNNRGSSLSGNYSPWDNSPGYGQPISRLAWDQNSSVNSSISGTAYGFNELSPSKLRRDPSPLQFDSSLGSGSLWSKQPYELFGVADKSPPKIQETTSAVDMEAMLLQSFRSCITKLLKLEGSDWLFRQNDGADEDLIDRVSAREKFLHEVEVMALLKTNEADHSKIMSVPNCGDECVWNVDLIISFGVWCIHRILELSLMESRPELWGKYTYVLNRLQGVIDPAFSKPRSAKTLCFCLELPVGYKQKSNPPPFSSDSLPPTSKLCRGKFTTAPMLLDMVKDVETAISCRKGRTGTAAGDVAFPKGKENLASVLKRYKRRLSKKWPGSQEVGHGSRQVSPPQGL